MADHQNDPRARRRVAGNGPARFAVARPPAPAGRRPGRHPAVVFVYGFIALIVVGTVLLMLPAAGADRRATPFGDALFTATSAVTVTGLVVVDTGTYWSGFGEAVILVLMQIGGFGFMTSSTMLLLLAGRRLGLRDRLLLREALGGGTLGSSVRLVRRIFVFTAVSELVGALVLTVRFLDDHSPGRALWWGVFHSISAFNSAGFDLTGGFRSMIPYQRDPVVLLTLTLLLVLGGISYAVISDIVRQRRFVRLSLDSKIVLVASALLMLFGSGGLLLAEQGNQQTLAGLAPAHQALNAVFIAARPCFNSVDLGRVTEGGLVILTIMMFIGGASGSTAGGIKVQTFALLIFAGLSAVRGLAEVEAYGRRVPTVEVLRAVAVALLATVLVVVAALLLTFTDEAGFLPDFFEIVSAFGTAGISTGITPSLSWPGRAILIVVMFAGRLGPLTLALALAARAPRRAYRRPEESVRIG